MKEEVIKGVGKERKGCEKKFLISLHAGRHDNKPGQIAFMSSSTIDIHNDRRKLGHSLVQYRGSPE